MMIHHVALGVVEKSVMLQQRVLKVVALDGGITTSGVMPPPP